MVAPHRQRAKMPMPKFYKQEKMGGRSLPPISILLFRRLPDEKT